MGRREGGHVNGEEGGGPCKGVSGVGARLCKHSRNAAILTFDGSLFRHN